MYHYQKIIFFVLLRKKGVCFFMKKDFLLFCLLPIHLLFFMDFVSAETVEYGTEKLQHIHASLQLLHGDFMEEYPEQLMTAMYLPSHIKVLELGGNLGRNSCVIASILENSRNLVTLETCKKDAKLLQENRDVNGLQFHIEVSALSRKPLIQLEWTTIPSDIDLPGYIRVDTITFDDLQEKYGITFDTLIVDCEGALYYILQDDPQILDNINLVIIENDFHDVNHMNYVKKLFLESGLQLVYNQSGNWDSSMNDQDGWWSTFQYDCFYQVWKK